MALPHAARLIYRSQCVQEKHSNRYASAHIISICALAHGMRERRRVIRDLRSCMHVDGMDMKSMDMKILKERAL